MMKFQSVTAFVSPVKSVVGIDTALRFHLGTLADFGGDAFGLALEESIALRGFPFGLAWSVFLCSIYGSFRGRRSLKNPYSTSYLSYVVFKDSNAVSCSYYFNYGFAYV